jgi:hypothetical protein
MSTSALASARRRRAGNDSITSPQIISRTNKPELVETTSQNQEVQKQPLTPLVILQQHEARIKQLEATITKEEDYEELFVQIDEKIDKLFSVNFEVYNNELNTLKSIVDTTYNTESTLSFTSMKSLVDDKLESHNSRIDDFKNSQTQLFNLFKDDTNKVNELLTSNLETKMTLINNTTTQLESKICELNSCYENQKNSANVLTKFETELGSVKTTIINIQSMMIEMSNTLAMFKETLELNKQQITSICSSMETAKAVQDQRTSTQALFSSLMSKQLFGAMDSSRLPSNGMLYCCESEECKTNNGCFNCEIENNGELNIDFNNNELLMDEVQLAELLEIKNFDTINIDDSSDDIIEVIDCDVNVETENVITTNDSITSESSPSDYVISESIIIEPLPNESITSEPIS